jgi:hypothetical protein
MPSIGQDVTDPLQNALVAATIANKVPFAVTYR